MKKILAILFIMIFAALPVCAKKRQAEEIITPMTQLQKRAFQVRTYKNGDKVVLMKSVLNVLQDEGYIVYNVNSLLGFIYAVKDFDTSDRNIDIAKEFGFSQSRLTYNGVKVATLESCVNITEYGNTVRARVNFERKLLNEYGNAQFIDDVEEEQFYQDFYAKVDREIEIQKQLNSSLKPVNLKKAPASKIIMSDKPSIKNTEKEQIETPDEEKTINNTEDKEESLTSEKEIIKDETLKNEETEEKQNELMTEDVQNDSDVQEQESPENLKSILKEAKKQAKEQAKAEKQAQKEQLKEMKIMEKKQAKEAKEYAKLQAKEAKEAKDKE